MNSKDIWNIVIKVNKKVIKINVSVFFFIFIPYVYYLDKGNSNLYINFFKNYVLLFVLYTAYKVVYNFLTKKNSYIYPFGVFTNNNFNLKVFNNSDSGIISKSHTINLTNLAILSFDIIFLSCFAFCYYINNFSYEVISYPIILLLTSIFAKDLFNNEGLKQNKKIYILIFSTIFFAVITSFELLKVKGVNFSLNYIAQNLFYNIEYSILFISFFCFVYKKEDLSELNNFGKEYFVKEIMTSKDFLKTLSPTDTVEQIIDDVMKIPQKIFPVLVNNKIVGIVRREEIIINFKVAIMDDYPLIDEIMTKVNLQVSPESNILIAKKIFDKSNTPFHCIPVVKDGNFTGLLFYELFIDFISMKKILFKLKINE